MRRSLIKLVILTLLVVGLLSGCVRAPLVALELRQYPPSLQHTTAKPDGLLVTVEPFIDTRPDDKFLGRSQFLWTRETVYGASGGDLGEIIAQMLATYLERERGWRAWLARATAGQPEDGPQVIFTGRILHCRFQVRDWGLVRTVTADVTLSVDFRSKMNPEVTATPILLNGTASAWFMTFQSTRLGAPLTDALLQAFRDLPAITSPTDAVLPPAASAPVPAEWYTLRPVAE